MEPIRGEEVVHLTKWRMASPQTLIGGGFASTKALAYFSNSLDYHLATLRAPAAPDPTAPLAEVSPGQRPGGAALHTTGLDAVDDGGGGHRIGREADEAVDELLAMAQGTKKEPVAKKKEEKKTSSEKGLSRLLAECAANRGEELLEKRRERSGKKRRHEDEDARAARRKRLRAEDSDSGESSASEAGFHVASSREVDLVRLSQKNPGCLLRSALKEMSRYLAARGEATTEDPGYGKVVSYLHQILLPQYPPKTGIRSHRELVTLATSLDLLLDGNLGTLYRGSSGSTLQSH